MRTDLRTEAVLQRRDDASAVGVVLRIRRGHDEQVERQSDLVAADLHVALLHHVEEPDLHALGEIWKLVQREDPPVGPRHQPVVDRELVGEIAALGDLDRVDLADEIGDRDVGRRELLAVSLVARQPHELHRIAVVRDAVLARGADRLERVVVDLAARDRRRDRVEKLDELAREACLRLSALAEEDDVLTRKDGVLDLRDHRRVVANDPLEERALLRQRGDEVRAELLLHRTAPVAGLAQRADGLRSVCHSTGSPLMSFGSGSPR